MAHTTQDRPKSASAQSVADAASKEGRRAADAGRDTVRTAKEGVARTVSDATDMARDEADRRVQAASGRAADEVAQHADAAEEAAAHYPEDSLPNEALSRVSGFLEDTARGLRDTDLEQVTGEVRRFARRNPVAFVAGAAAVGFAAARLLRASERDDEEWARMPGNGSHDSWFDVDPTEREHVTPSELREQQPATGGPTVPGRQT